jgi:hypothetical protein
MMQALDALKMATSVRLDKFLLLMKGSFRKVEAEKLLATGLSTSKLGPCFKIQ